jgi:hypothetical protein
MGIDWQDQMRRFNWRHEKMNRAKWIGFTGSCLVMLLLWLQEALPQDVAYSYRVLATNKTSTMEKEMNEASAAGFAFSATMGGETAFGGDEAVVVMIKDPAKSAEPKRDYRLVATSKTSTMQKEMQQLGNEGFEYRGQTAFKTTFGGQEVCVIMERASSNESGKMEYKLLATSRTSTMQKELQQAGDAGFYLVGMTVGKTAFGGAELISILQKQRK